MTTVAALMGAVPIALGIGGALSQSHNLSRLLHRRRTHHFAVADPAINPGPLLLLRTAAGENKKMEKSELKS